jgi:hypothetical protein
MYTYVQFLLRMADTVTSQNIDFFLWETCIKVNPLTYRYFRRVHLRLRRACFWCTVMPHTSHVHTSQHYSNRLLTKRYWLEEPIYRIYVCENLECRKAESALPPEFLHPNFCRGITLLPLECVKRFLWEPLCVLTTSRSSNWSSILNLRLLQTFSFLF